MRHVKTAAIAILMALTLALPTRAEAQCPTGVVVGVPRIDVSFPPVLRVRIGGPVVRVIGPCVPPPPLVVRVVPAPPPPPPPPPVVQPIECPPPVAVQRRVPRPRLFTIGLFTEGTFFKEGAMAGAGLYAQLRLTRGLHLLGSIGAAASCSACNPDDLQRTDLKTTLGLQWYFVRRFRLAPYLRGSLVYQRVAFHDPNGSDDVAEYNAHQVGFETALGLEWRITRWLVLGADVAYLGLKHAAEREAHTAAADGLSVPSREIPGVPRVNDFDHGASFRLNLALRF